MRTHPKGTSNVKYIFEMLEQDCSSQVYTCPTNILKYLGTSESRKDWYDNVIINMKWWHWNIENLFWGIVNAGVGTQRSANAPARPNASEAVTTLRWPPGMIFVPPNFAIDRTR